MDSMNIAMPDTMKEWVEAQVNTGQYGNASEFMRDLIRHEQERQKIDAFQRLIDEAAASGVSAKSVHEVFEMAKAEARERGLF